MSSARRGRASTTTHPPHGRGPGTRRLRILFIASQFPFPADSGATIKSKSIIDYLRGAHELRLLSLTGSPLTAAQEKWSSGLDGVRTVRLSMARSAVNLARSYLARVPMSVFRNRSGNMRSLVESEAVEYEPDIVLADGWVTGQYVKPDLPGLKLLHEHNAEFELWERQANLERGLLGFLIRLEGTRVRRHESGLLNRFDVTLAVSAEDRRALGRIGGDMNRIKILPNIPDSQLLSRPAPEFADTPPVVLYFGTLSWQPNIEGLERYLSFAHKQVLKQVPEARLLVAGKGASVELLKKIEEAPNTEFAGEVADAEELYARARVTIDTSRSGGGTRLKILNSLARGIPVVASAEAARGLDIVPGEHMIVVRNEHGLVEGVTQLLQDEERWRVMSANGRALIRAKYVSDMAFTALDEVLARAQKTGR